MPVSKMRSEFDAEWTGEHIGGGQWVLKKFGERSYLQKLV